MRGSTNENDSGQNEEAPCTRGFTRRGFLGLGALVGASVAATGLAGCSPKTSSNSSSEGTDSAADATTGYSFETAPEAIPDSQISATKTYDVVVVGGSSSGLSAAASAADEGASVICIEKTGKAQGAGTYYGFINTKMLAENGMPTVDESAYANKLIEAALGACDPKLVHTYVANSSKVGDWLADVVTSTGNKVLFSSALGTENTVYFDDSASGSSIYNALTDYGTSKGAEYIYDTEVVCLERADDGQITGVIAKGSDGTYTRYAANKGVILATGAYNGNTEMVEKYIPWVDLKTTIEFTPLSATGNTGDGLKMALWSGARIGSVPHCPMIHFISGAMPIAGSLFVNGAGRRFMNEGTSMEVIAQILMRQPGHAMYQIGDAKPSGMALMMSMAAGGAPATGTDASATATSTTSSESSASGPSGSMGSTGESYDTLDELAAAHNMDAKVLKATVDRWNELVAKGVDEDFGSDFMIAQTIDTPPYTFTESPGCRLAMMGGPQVDYNMEVLDEDYSPIPGLYAAGNCTCGFFGPNYPMQAQSGIARAYSTVSGYLAAKNAIAG